MEGSSKKITYRFYVMFLVFILLMSSCGNLSNKEKDSSTTESDQNNTLDETQGKETGVDLKKPSIQELFENDYVLYFVNCGTSDVNFLSSNDKMGIYQSVTDQVFGADSITGNSWGYQEKDYMIQENNPDNGDKNESKWVINEGVEYNLHETGFYYDFELPSGEYEIICGFNNPFSFRTINIVSENETVVEGQKLLKYRLVEASYIQTVTDGVLNILVNNPQRGKDAMKNPILSYIIIRAVPEYTLEELELLTKEAKELENNGKTYSKSSMDSLYFEISNSEELIKKGESDMSEIKEQFLRNKEAVSKLVEIDIYDSFQPGNVWNDLEGNFIQAHGGQIQKLEVVDKTTGELVQKWWWVGEDKTLGYRGGICAYSSDDLYNWNFEGVVMRNVNSREQLDNEEYFKSLYDGYTKEQLDNVYLSINDSTSVIERPKMIYNEKTEKYIMWFHADGPTETSTANYAAASAGVAISDSPYGPFRFIDRYRLNTCPPDQEDMFPESKGMARDMNLFVDDDGKAYIIYSSEENLTMYISRLNNDYTYLDKSPEDAVYGVDFIRIFPGAQREAPAVFKRNGIYYMMTSGATGWNPNQARYAISDSIFGTWENMGDPCIDDTKLTTFDSQSTCIFNVSGNDYIYMGDRWNSEDLTNSRYIWLPVQFDEDGKMSISWIEEWKY